jgi:hypothetical protein
MARAMAIMRKRAMATKGDTTGSGYRCPSSSAVAAAAVGKDDKDDVVMKKMVCAFSQY